MKAIIISSSSNRSIIHPEYDPTIPHNYFDGAPQLQGKPGLSRAGEWPFLPTGERLSFKLGLGKAINYRAELTAVSTLLEISWVIGIKAVAVYGDSQEVLGWISCSTNDIDIYLQARVRSVQALISYFYFFSHIHMYRELNKEAGQLTKWAVSVIAGSLQIEQSMEGPYFLLPGPYFDILEEVKLFT